MPIYEYQCQQCAAVTEKIQKLSDKPLTKCEACGGKLVKLLSRTAFVLKGSGWYKDGYGAKQGAKADSSATPSASESGNVTESKADAPASSKPASDSGGSSATPKRKKPGKS
jgi:putative FmdB family regulatory protein